jgi:tetratricopeptide (TPR) repeat protein
MRRGAVAVHDDGTPTTREPTMNPTETYERALDQLLRFKPEVVDLAGELTAQHPRFAMGQALMAYLCLIATDVPELPAARAAHAAMLESPLDERESMHAAAIDAWLVGDWHRSAAVLDDLLHSWPTDALALMVGHQLDFFLGDARNLRDRPARVLEAFDPSDHRLAAVRGMHAFGLEESGEYEKAEDVGMSAIAATPDDVWAIHAVVHSLEMRGLVERGIPFLRQRVDDWGDGNLFTVHNWWHLTLFELEAGHHAEVLDIYDGHIHNAESAGVPLEMIDASALLWRLMLDGVDSGDRFAALASGWESRVADEPWYAFNDLHAAMAFAGAGRLDDAKAVVAKLEVDLGCGPSNAKMTAEVGLPAARAIVAFAEERHDDVVDELAPIRRQLYVFGGSHAQRDVLHRTLLESALRSRRLQFAGELISERLAVREASVYGWTSRQRLLSALGDEHEALRAGEQAAELQARFAAA